MQQQRTLKTFLGFTVLVLIYIVVTGIVVHLTGGKANEEERAENAQWVASSHSWLDRQVCRWIGVCGTTHMIWTSRWTWSDYGKDPANLPEQDDFWKSGVDESSSWSPEERRLREIPQYVLDHAPYVHLFSGEDFWPGDLSEHLQHTTPYINYTEILGLNGEPTVDNLSDLNDYENGRNSRYVYLHSNENVEEWPEWLSGRWNIPTRPERTPDGNTPPPPSMKDLKYFNLETAQQHALIDSRDDLGALELAHVPYEDLVPSLDGRCGGNTGFTCKGSRFGGCCSIYGWCGKTEAFCAMPCDPTSGTCERDPLHPSGPHTDLRRRRGHGPSTDDLTQHQNTQHRPSPGGRSSAPAFLIVVPKEDGIVDAFWFFFYSFNLGQKVFNIRFGNHIGDWEHTAIRFQHGRPIEVFLSEHDFGEALSWSAVEKYLPAHDDLGTMIGSWTNATAARHAVRPVIYSAHGSHAMYATPGLHPYVIPFGLLRDETDRGPLWDPAQNVAAYTYDPARQRLRASTRTPAAPTAWFDFAGHWGDKYYALSDPRQYRLAGQYHYVNGPLGPKFKNLGRRSVCQGTGACAVRDWIGDPTLPSGTPPEEEAEVGGLPGGNVTDERW